MSPLLRKILFSGVVGILTACQPDFSLFGPEEVNKWIYFREANDNLVSDEIEVLFEDANGWIWVGTTNGISVYDGIFNDIPSGLSDPHIFSVLEFDGTVVLGTGDGFTYFDQGGPVAVTSSDLGLQPFNVHSMVADKNDLLTLGTNRYGILRFSNGNMTQFFDDSCNDCNIIYTLIKDSEDVIWVGSAGGLKTFDNDVFSSVPGFSGANVLSLFEDSRGDIWVGYEDAPYVTRISNGEVENIFLNIDFALFGSVLVLDIDEDQDGNLWFATIAGLLKYDGVTFEIYNTESSDLHQRDVGEVLFDNSGNMWVGTYDKGIAVYLSE